MNINVLLVDDHKILRDSLKIAINNTGHLTVVGEADNGRDAVRLCSKLNPHVAIMDITMKGLNGIEATHQILSQNPNIKIIALSMHGDKRYVISMLKAGAYGYMLKDTDFKELITAIDTVVNNQKYMCQQISNVIINEFMNQAADKETELTSREKEILQLIAEGHSSKEIGETLFLSSKTVDAHRKNIMDKLKAHSIPELTKHAIKLGLSALED